VVFLGKKILDSVIMILATENLGFLKGMMVKYLAMIRLGKVIYYLVSLFSFQKFDTSCKVCEFQL
jgi:hypothetical protein